MLVSINLVKKLTGISIYSINCTYNEDLVSAFLTAMEAFCTEVFHSTGFHRIDLDNVFIETVHLGSYKLILIFDNEGNNNEAFIIDRIKEICKEEKFAIERAMTSSKRIGEGSNFNVKLLDAISDFFSDKFGNDTLKLVSRRMEGMIRYRNSLNIYIQLRLLEAKIKVGSILGEDISPYEALMEEVGNKMSVVISDAEYYLKKIKNLIYEQYGATKDVEMVDWLELYSYVGNFQRNLEKITRSEIAEKYLDIATKVINGKGDNLLLSEVAEDIMNMDSDINMYIKF